MTPEISEKDARLHKALSHPLRHRILRRLNDGEASPSDLARQLDEPLGNVSYHVKILLDNDAIELVKTEPVRGAVEHFYRPSARPIFDTADLAGLPASARDQYVASTLRRLLDDAVDAARDGGFDDPSVHVSSTPLELDQRGYDEITTLLANTLSRAHDIHAASAERQAAADAAPAVVWRTELSILHHRRREP